MVCHRCDNPPCVELTHLFLGTSADNIRDSVRKGRHYRGGCPPPSQVRGETDSAAKLRADQVVAILDAVASGRTQRSLAHELGISKTTIGDICRGKTWAHIPRKAPEGASDAK
ncbi:MAG TPA: helix-turn-helix domain-containing protein [Chloroflexota bacterium]|nr:helix-turn-helix domain-containing protein [Chloroflexota bacterium]